MEKIFIKNREEKKICVLIEQPIGKCQGLVFVMHGLSGHKEEPQIQVMARAFLEARYLVVRWDARDTFGESDGNYENATISSYYADLEDVINWAKGQSWYQAPFVLIGHSLGGICTALYAERNPKEVKAVAPIASVISGALMIQADQESKPEIFKEWEMTGWRTSRSESRPGVLKKLHWVAFKTDSLHYDLLKNAGHLVMPVLFIVGDLDQGTPAKHQKLLFDAIMHDKKEFHIIKNSGHTFQQDPANLLELRAILNSWIKKL